MNESIKTPPEQPENVGENLAVRQTYTAKVIALFQSRPKEWIEVHELAAVGGFAAWRTRVSEARESLERGGGTLEWNHKQRQSAYRYLPWTPLGRDAGHPPTAGQLEMF